VTKQPVGKSSDFIALDFGAMRRASQSCRALWFLKPNTVWKWMSQNITEWISELFQ